MEEAILYAATTSMLLSYSYAATIALVENLLLQLVLLHHHVMSEVVTNSSNSL
jgi:hypothetical protein